MAGQGGVVVQVDDDDRFAWSPTTGWLAVPTNEVGVRAVFDLHEGAHLAGYVWSESIGWISFGSPEGGPYENTAADNWGVNMGDDGTLSGYAYGPTIGWISFDEEPQTRIHPLTGVFNGFAHSPQIGPIRWGGSTTSPVEYGVHLDIALAAFDVPEYWLLLNGFTNELGEIDINAEGLAWEAFFENTDPSDPEARLRFTLIDAGIDPATTELAFSSALHRFYRVSATEDLTADPVEWIPLRQLAGTGGVVEIIDATNRMQRFYRVQVGIDPEPDWPAQ